MQEEYKEWTNLNLAEDKGIRVEQRVIDIIIRTRINNSEEQMASNKKQWGTAQNSKGNSNQVSRQIGKHHRYIWSAFRYYQSLSTRITNAIIRNIV